MKGSSAGEQSAIVKLGRLGKPSAAAVEQNKHDVIKANRVDFVIDTYLLDFIIAPLKFAKAHNEFCLCKHLSHMII